MKKVLPIFLVLAVGLGIIAGVFLVLKNSFKSSEEQTPKSASNGDGNREEVLKQLSAEESPFASLTPRADGREFHLLISNIPQGVENLEYELVYKVASGVTQGVPGTVKVVGKSSIERDLLLGTCSSGKCRYDEGVENGTFAIRLRNSKGQLMAKMETQFHLQKNGKELSAADGKFSLSQSKASSGAFYLTMGTFGLPTKTSEKVTAGPYGIFTKSALAISGKVSLPGEGTLYNLNGKKWEELSDGKSSSLGIFVRMSPR